ncbi:MAG: hypothetical protein WEA59_04590, partial [Ferruginibacter sp.]
MSCSTTKKSTKSIDDPTSPITPQPIAAIPPSEVFLTNLLKAHPNQMSDILANAKSLNAQIIYTTIDRSKNGIPSFTQHYFNTAHNDYFYPASTVKFPIVLLALEKLKELNKPNLDR